MTQELQLDVHHNKAVGSSNRALQAVEYQNHTKNMHIKRMLRRTVKTILIVFVRLLIMIATGELDAADKVVYETPFFFFLTIYISCEDIKLIPNCVWPLVHFYYSMRPRYKRQSTGKKNLQRTFIADCRYIIFDSYCSHNSRKESQGYCDRYSGLHFSTQSWLQFESKYTFDLIAS